MQFNSEERQQIELISEALVVNQQVLNESHCRNPDWISYLETEGSNQSFLQGRLNNRKCILKSTLRVGGVRVEEEDISKNL